MLSRKFSLPLVVGALLLAGPAWAISTVYDMTGSSMVMVNSGGLCTALTPCIAPVTGFLSLDDDGVGNVTLTSMSLSHGPYEVGSPPALSVILDRVSITPTAADLGSGTTVNGVTTFGSTTLWQTGTVTCAGVCSFAGLPVGVTPLANAVPVNLGAWSFDLLGNLSFASIVYTSNALATETLNLTGTPTTVPEPGTAMLLVAGLVGMALRRRAGL